jgi:D-aminopeptidase
MFAKVQSSSTAETPRMRVRELLPDLHLGDYTPGPLNSLTDVPGVKVHTQEIFGDGGNINTGVTSILPREDWSQTACYANIFRFNGAGELTGGQYVAETGLLQSPIILTGTFGVGAAHQGSYEYAIKTLGAEGNWLFLPMVGETFDGYLHNPNSFAVKPEHIVSGLEKVSAERVREGNVGGGVGMICHFFKGGTGSSSRVLPPHGDSKKTYTIAALVQANYGKMTDFRLAGAPVGRILAAEAAKNEFAKAAQEKLAEEKDRKDGSIIVVLATDAPLHPLQLQRVAKRATVGLARVGGQGHNLSGDIFLAFSTGNGIPVNQSTSTPNKGPAPLDIEVINDSSINSLFEAAADVTEEAIYNALCMAETMVGNQGHKVEALPLDRVKEIMAKYI